MMLLFVAGIILLMVSARAKANKLEVIDIGDTSSSVDSNDSDDLDHLESDYDLYGSIQSFMDKQADYVIN